jgi:hypothetical protein
VQGKEKGLSHISDLIQNPQDYWVFGICPLSGILKHTKEHNVSDT